MLTVFTKHDYNYESYCFSSLEKSINLLNKKLESKNDILILSFVNKSIDDDTTDDNIPINNMIELTIELDKLNSISVFDCYKFKFSGKFTLEYLYKIFKYCEYNISEDEYLLK